MVISQVFEPGYFPVTPDENLILADNLSLQSNIQPLEMTAATYFIINDMKVAETETKVDKSYVFFEDCVHEEKCRYDNEEYDMVSLTTETLDKPSANYPATQDCNSEFSNRLYVKEELYSF